MANILKPSVRGTLGSTAGTLKQTMKETVLECDEIIVQLYKVIVIQYGGAGCTAGGF